MTTSTDTLTRLGSIAVLVVALVGCRPPAEPTEQIDLQGKSFKEFDKVPKAAPGGGAQRKPWEPTRGLSGHDLMALQVDLDCIRTFFVDAPERVALVMPLVFEHYGTDEETVKKAQSKLRAEPEKTASMQKTRGAGQLCKDGKPLGVLRRAAGEEYTDLPESERGEKTADTTADPLEKARVDDARGAEKGTTDAQKSKAMAIEAGAKSGGDSERLDAKKAADDQRALPPEKRTADAGRDADRAGAKKAADDQRALPPAKREADARRDQQRTAEKESTDAARSIPDDKRTADAARDAGRTTEKERVDGGDRRAEKERVDGAKPEVSDTDDAVKREEAGLPPKEKTEEASPEDEASE